MATSTDEFRADRFSGIPLRWQTFVALGIILVALGIFALGASSLATLASVLVFGWALIIGGVLQIGHAIYQRRWGGRVLDILTGVVFIGVGVLAAWRPLISAVSLTFVIAAAFIMRGVFAIVAAASERYHHWGLGLGYGVVSAILGTIILLQWPGISLWVIGLLVGIELVVDGGVLALTGLGVRKAREEARGPLPERRPPTPPRAPEEGGREPVPAAT